MDKEELTHKQERLEKYSRGYKERRRELFEILRTLDCKSKRKTAAELGEKVAERLHLDKKIEAKVINADLSQFYAGYGGYNKMLHFHGGEKGHFTSLYGSPETRDTIDSYFSLLDRVIGNVVRAIQRGEGRDIPHEAFACKFQNSEISCTILRSAGIADIEYVPKEE